MIDFTRSRGPLVCALAAVSLFSGGCASERGAAPAASPAVRTVAMPRSPSASANSVAIAELWKWFAANSERLTHITEHPQALSSEVAAKVKAIHPGLTFEFGPKQTFAVSADGDTALFPLVEEVVKQAPAISGWTIVAFRQRRPKDAAMKYRGATVSDVWYSSEPVAPRLSIHLYVKGLTQDNKDAVGGAALLLMEGALGEYDAFTVVSLDDMEPLPPDPRKAKLHPISELPAEVDAFKARQAAEGPPGPAPAAGPR